MTQVGEEDAQAMEHDAQALEAVADQIEVAAAEEHAAAATVRELAAERRKGHSWMHIAEHGSLRSALDRIGHGVQSLRSGAARLRRTTARGLVAEGASTRRIGSLFGVSHQRVSSIVAGRGTEQGSGREHRGGEERGLADDRTCGDNETGQRGGISAEGGGISAAEGQEGTDGA